MDLSRGILSLQLEEITRLRTSPLDRKSNVNLAPYDGGRFALVLHQVGQQTIMRGVATYENDQALGAILRIRTSEGTEQEPSLPEFILQEGVWKEKIVADLHFGCDFAIDLFVP